MPTILERLKTLTAIDAIPGHEQPLVAFLQRALEPTCDAVEVDAVGNLYAIRRGPKSGPTGGPQGGPTVMIAAHTDEIGMIVKSVEPSGFVRFEKVGGVIDNLLAARLVRVGSHLGVVGMKSGHYQSAAERSAVRPHTEMYVDLGARSAEAVADMGIEVGTPITFVSDLVEFGHDASFVAGKAIDNRLGCAVLWHLLDDDRPPAGTLVAAFTSQEEVGLRGAGIAGERIRPDLALALDTMPSGDTPDMDAHKDLDVALGAGPVLQVSAGGRGGGIFLVNQAVKRFVQRTAADAGVPLQLATFSAGNNDATTIAWSGLGVPTAAICLPRRYSHSPMEVADMADADATFRLLRAVVAAMGDLPPFGFLDTAS